MQAIDQVARLGSIRRAAAAIAISPSALNRQILTVEEEIGAEIFERLPRGVRLSTAGEIYLRCFRAHLSELDRAASQVADLSGLRAGAITLGVSEELASGFAPQVVSAYQARHPMVDIAMRIVRPDDIGQALRSFDIDIAVVVNCIQDETIETIHAESLEILCASSGDGGLGEDIHLSDLVGRPLIAPSVGSGLRSALDAALSFRNLPRRYALETDRLSPALLRANAAAVQFLLAIDAPAGRLEALGLSAHRLSPKVAPEATASLLSLRYRALPVATAKLASDLTKALATA